MFIKKIVSFLMMSFLFYSCLFLFTDNAKAAENFSLTIMHVNDSHARVNQYPKLTTAVQSIRVQNPNALLLDAGDVFSGTDYFTRFQGQADLFFMNYLNYDAMTIGNHEFDKGASVLAEFIKRTKFPVVNANANFSTNAALAPLFQNQITYNAIGGKIYPAIIKEVNGEKIAIFGLLTQSYTSLNSTYGIQDSTTRAQAIVTSLKQQGINKIVLLSHLGYDRDQALANAVKGIDVIVGGHTHTKLSKPTLVNNTEPTVIVQAQHYLTYLGVLNLTFNSSGVIQSYDGRLLTVNNYAANPDAQAKLNQINSTGLPTQETAKDEGWVKTDGESYYYVNGVKLTGWQTIDGNRYYFGSTSGILKTGFYVISGKTYYFGDDGVMRTGWQTINSNTYYFGTDGVMYTGQKTIDGKVYTFGSNGILESEVPSTQEGGWVVKDGEKYYYGADGVMYTSWRTIDGNRYYFGSYSGILKTGFYVISGKTYYFGDDGVMRTGWQTINSNTYYFGTDGVMYTGQKTIDGKVYTFNSNGILQA